MPQYQQQLASSSSQGSTGSISTNKRTDNSSTPTQRRSPSASTAQHLQFGPSHSPVCINYAHVEYVKQKCLGRDYRLSYYTSCPYIADEELVLAHDISDDVHRSFNSTQNSSETSTPYSKLSPLSMSDPDLALPAANLDIVQMHQTADTHLIVNRKQYWMFRSNLYCTARGSTNMLQNWYLPDYQATWSTCGQHGHSTITWPIVDKILALHKISLSPHLSQSSASDWNRSASPTDPDWASTCNVLTTSSPWTPQKS